MIKQVFFYTIILIGTLHASDFKEDLKPVTPSQRLAIVKEMFNNNPNFTKETPVGKLSEHYRSDSLFIREEINSRSDSSAILEELKKMDSYWADKIQQNPLSFCDYAYIGYTWSNVLSRGNFDQILQEQNHGINRLQKKWYMDSFRKGFSDFHGIPLKNVSKSGLVPLKILNKGLGFFDNNKSP